MTTKPEVPSYESLVKCAEDCYQRRVAELKKAEPLIRELRDDLGAIAAAGIWLADDYGFHVCDGRTPAEDARGARQRPALHLCIANVFSETRRKAQVRLAELLLERGWTVMHSRLVVAYESTVYFGKKGIRARIACAVPASWFSEQVAPASADGQQGLSTVPSCEIPG